MTTYVGDAVEVTFSTTPGATVTVTWIGPDGQVVVPATPVPESPAASGKYPHLLTPTTPGMWEARFIATGTATETEPYYLRALAIGGPPPLATVAEVVELFRTLTPAEEGLTKALLRQASTMVRSRPGVIARIADGTLDAEMVGHAVVTMVLRVLRNPGGLRAETVGPFSRTFDTTVAAGQLVISDTELAILNPPSTAGTAQPARTIMARPGPLLTAWVAPRGSRQPGTDCRDIRG